jgi:hypothetical protein
VQALDPDIERGRWHVTWLVSNQGSEPVRLETAWVPHGRFRGDGRVTVGHDLPPTDSYRLTLTTTALEPPGTIVENAFLIILAVAGDERWRFFIRMTVDFDAQQKPLPRVETITLQASAIVPPS